MCSPVRSWFACVLACLVAVASGPASADAAAGDPIVVGPARFTVITPNCVRLEFSPGATFVDAPSYFAANRSAGWGGATVTRDAGGVTIDTGPIRLTYTPDGHPFGPGNLAADIRGGTGTSTVRWRPGSPNRGNLGGTTRTLDGWDGAGRLSDGLLSRDGWYLLDDSRSVLLSDGWARARPAGAGTDWYLFGYGTDYRAALRSFTAVSGPVPLPRRYMLGAWYSRYWPYSADEYRAIVKEYADHGFPLDVLVMDMDWHTDGWTGYTWNRKLLGKDPRALFDWLHAQHLAVTLNDHPADGVGKQEASYAPFMRAMGLDPATCEPLKFDAGDRRYLDTFYAYTHRPYEDMGVDFWWLDWQQYANTRSIPALTNLEWLNHYNFGETGRDGRRGASFSRWGGWGSQRYPIQFSGDASTSFRMLAFEVPFTAAGGNVGAFYWSHDIGGHNRGRNEESYARWCQFGAFSAALRSHSTRDATMDRRPWTYPKWAEDAMRASFGLRSRFFPYLYTAAAAASAESVPFIRPMYIDHPADEAAYHNPQQYQFGDDLIVAPIAEAGVGPDRVGSQTVWFPPGGPWYDLFTGQRYAGGQQVLTAAPIGQFPLYVRGGVPVPTRPFTNRMATDPLTDLIVRCHPGTDGQTGTADLYEDDGLTTAYRTGGVAHTRLTYARAGDRVTVTIAPTVGTFAGQVERRTVTVELPGMASAATATVDGAPAQVEPVAADDTVRVRVPARSVRAGCAVVVTAAAVDPDVVRRRALARRTGVADAGSTADVLAAALAKDATDLDRGATCALAGVGVFGRVESAYGYPATPVDQTFAPADLPVQVTPLSPDADDLSAVAPTRFSVTVAGRVFAAARSPQPVDWKRRPGNLASAAKVTVSSGGATAGGLTNGRVGGYPADRADEWTTDGEQAGAWARFAWAGPQTVDGVVLFDRPNANDHVLGGRLEFSDGTAVPFGPLDNAAAVGTAVRFPAKMVTWVKVTIASVAPTTENTGLSEVVILGPPATTGPVGDAPAPRP